MLKHFIIALLLFASARVSAQNRPLLVKQLKGIQIDQISKIDSFVVKKMPSQTVKFFVRQYGWLDVPESHGVSYEILVSIQENDENPLSKLFSIAPLVGPIINNDGAMRNGNYEITFTAGFLGKRTTKKMIISESAVVVK